MLSLYKKVGENPVVQSENHLYGSSRVGMQLVNRTQVDYEALKGMRLPTTKRYELSNHLGNVLTTITGRKIGIIDDPNVPFYYKPEVIQASDYYAYGLELPSRKYQNTPYAETIAYRYGFNGKELDKSGEFGSLTHYDYGFRIYNPSIGKFLSVDPLTKSYPWYTPYQFAGNSPIANVDLDGLEKYHYSLIQNSETCKLEIKFEGTEYRKTGWFQFSEDDFRKHNGEKWDVELYWLDVNPEESYVFSSFSEMAQFSIDYQNGINTKQSQQDIALEGLAYAMSALIPMHDAALNGSQANLNVNPQLKVKVSKEQSKAPIKKEPVKLYVDNKSRSPEASMHADEAIESGIENRGVIDRAGAEKRRLNNLRGIKTEKTKDRDEFPPAVINTNSKVSVKLINSSDNRGSGSSIRHQIKDLPDGTPVIVLPKDIQGGG